MADYRAQLAKDRHEFENIARMKLREVCRHDTSSFANVERVVDLLGEWVMRLSDPEAEAPVCLRSYKPSRLRQASPLGYRSDHVQGSALLHTS